MLTEYAIVPSITQTEQARPSKSAAEWKAQAPLMSGMFGEGLCPVRSSKGKRLTQMKKGYYRPPGAPIYVLTNEAIITAEDAWRIVFAYMRRWRIEMSFRHLKSDMAIQSLRVYRWEDRLKLLGLLTLAYGFLMNLMREEVRAAREWLLDFACHRRGRRTREVDIPFSRVRLALSKLWLAFPCWFVRRGKLNL